MSVCTFERLPSLTMYHDLHEFMKYRCLEKPCVDNGVQINSWGLDTHAVAFHNADHIEIRDGKTNLDTTTEY